VAELTSAAAPAGPASAVVAPSRFARARRVVVDAWNRFFFSEEPVVGAVAFRWWFAAWTFAYFLPRVPYAEELWARPVLRQTARQWKWIGDPMAPLWLLYLALAVLFVLLILFAIGWHARVMHVLLVVPFYFLMAQDTVMPRAYGSIASWQWILFFFVAYDRLRDDDGAIAMRPRWGLRIVQLLFASIYFFAVFAKLVDGAGWWTGKAVHNSMASERYGNFLLSNLPLPDWLAFIYSWTTLGLEFTIHSASTTKSRTWCEDSSPPVDAVIPSP
jgi:hypothetical protein